MRSSAASDVYKRPSLDRANVRGSTRLHTDATGHATATVPAGRLSIDIHPYGASGSLPVWEEKQFARPAGLWTSRPVFERGGTATIVRPPELTGTWRVRASYRAPGETEWFGSWVYGTTEDTLELQALKPAEWRFQILDDPNSQKPLEERFAQVGSGDSVLVGR